MIQIPFNKETAKEITEKKRLGKVMTRDGFEVTITSWDIDAAYPIGGIVHLGGHNDYLRQWREDGKADYRTNVTTRFDLFLEVEEGGKE